MQIDDKDKLDILMQHERIAVDEMDKIKQNEMSWLKVFLLFYSGLIAWSVA